MSVMMKGFAIKKVIKNGRVQHEEGIAGEYDGNGARLVEMQDGKGTFTELTNEDIRRLISIPAKKEGLESRLLALLPRAYKRHARGRRKKRRRHSTKRRHRSRRRRRSHTRRRPHRRRRTPSRKSTRRRTPSTRRRSH